MSAKRHLLYSLQMAKGFHEHFGKFKEDFCKQYDGQQLKDHEAKFLEARLIEARLHAERAADFAKQIELLDGVKGGD